MKVSVPETVAWTQPPHHWPVPFAAEGVAVGSGGAGGVPDREPGELLTRRHLQPDVADTAADKPELVGPEQRCVRGVRIDGNPLIEVVIARRQPLPPGVGLDRPRSEEHTSE